MPKFLVRVRRLADGSEQDMSYKGFTYIEDDIDDITDQKKWELIGEVDSKGNLMPGSPNLAPQHKTNLPSQQPSVAPVASVGETVKPEAPQEQKAAPKRRGPKPQVKLQETTA